MSATVPKTYKLFINGAFPRSESGRSLPVQDRHGAVIAHLCRASRKDLRDAVEAARGALPKWWGMTAYNRAQILYRMAEMLDGRRAEFAESLKRGGDSGNLSRARKPAPRTSSARPASAKANAGSLAPDLEVSTAVDRLVSFAGWADKHAEVLGHRAAVAGPYHVFSHPEPSGVTAVVAPNSPALLGLVALSAAAICVGNCVVALASEANPIPAALFGEVLATSDLPGGVFNILTGERAELLPHIATHREIRAVSAADCSADHARALREGAAENLKRVTITPRGADAAWLDDEFEVSPARFERLVEIKTIWHPSAV